MASLRDWLAQPNRWEFLARVACVAVFLVLVARFGHPHYGFTRFLQLDAAGAAQMTPALRAAPLYTYAAEGRYDGAYYGQLASDPLLRDPELAGGIDSVAYRARRIAAPALAHALAFGDRVEAVRSYAWLNIAAWLALAALAWRLLPCGDARRFAAWAGLLFSAGVLHSVRLALVDLPALAALTGALVALEARRLGWAAAALAAAALSRETTLLAAGVLAWTLWRERERRGAAVLLLAAAALPVVVWFAWVQARVGPGAGGWDNFDWPLSGLWAKARELAVALRHEPDRALVWTTGLATIAGLAQAAYFLVQRRPGAALGWIGLGYALLLVPLDSAVWEGHPGAFTRVLLPLTLAFFVSSARERAAWAWLVVGSLSLPAGGLALARVSHEPHELAAGRTAAASHVVHTDAAFHPAERGGGRVWAWARESGTITIDSWPRQGRTATVIFQMRALAPRPVIVRVGERVAWSGEIGPTLTIVRVPEMVLREGRAVLRVETPAAPVREGAETGRALSFAIYDVRLE